MKSRSGIHKESPSNLEKSVPLHFESDDSNHPKRTIPVEYARMPRANRDRTFMRHIYRMQVLSPSSTDALLKHPVLYRNELYGMLISTVNASSNPRG